MWMWRWRNFRAPSLPEDDGRELVELVLGIDITLTERDAARSYEQPHRKRT